MKKYLFLTAAMAFSTQASSAITQVWTNESAFLSANSGLAMESFEQSGLPTSPNTTPIAAGDITISTDSTAFGGVGVNTFTFFGVTDGNQNIYWGSDDDASIFFNFSSAVNTFGINIFDFGTTGGNPLLTFFDGKGNSTTALTGERDEEGELDFFGLASDIAFTTVQLKYTGSTGDGIFFDEAYYGNVSAVPVPAAAFLFAPALFGLLGLRRRAKNKVT